jgi:Fe-S-cluster containining protein
MVAECKANSQLLKRVAEIYKWLDSQICKSAHLSGICGTCGKCCDFESFDHRLFVTTPELMYLAANLGAENVKPMTTSRGSTPRLRSGQASLTTGCPYNIKGKCSIYEHRFAGCRIFSCKGDTDFQSGLSERALKKLKSLCTEFQVPYRYTDLATALNSFTVA